MKIFFTSDTHFGFENMAKIRGFKNIESMDKLLINNWNSIVGENDFVYHLGDFGRNNIKDYVNKLNGKIIIVRGNHDNNINISQGFQSIHDLIYYRNNKRRFHLCHYPLECWNHDENGCIHLHGHMHGDSHRGYLKKIKNRFDIGCDTNNLFPYSLESILIMADTQIINENYISDNV